jgi:hypothetical protein
MNHKHLTSFTILRTTETEVVLLWVMTPLSLIDGYQSSRETYFRRVQNVHTDNCSNSLPSNDAMLTVNRAVVRCHESVQTQRFGNLICFHHHVTDENYEFLTGPTGCERFHPYRDVGNRSNFQNTVTDETQEDGQRLRCCSSPHVPSTSFTVWTLNTLIPYNGLGSAVWGHEHCSAACTCYRQKLEVCRMPRLEYAFSNTDLEEGLSVMACNSLLPSVGSHH